MDVLCTDKTGTLTEGVVRLDGALDADGAAHPRLSCAAPISTPHYQTGLDQPVGRGHLRCGQQAGIDLGAIAEDRRDSLRLRAQAPERGGRPTQRRRAPLITKGALDNVLATVHARAGRGRPASARRRRAGAAIERRYRRLERAGLPRAGRGHRSQWTPQPASYTRADESGLTFAGFLLFFDPPKAGRAARRSSTCAQLRRRSSRSSPATTSWSHGTSPRRSDLPIERRADRRRAERHERRGARGTPAERTTVFAEVEPNQKERIILALQKTGHVVGYMGDGINDAPALHAADVGISVDTAVDVAKEAADFVLLEQDLDVLRRGIEEGRTTFANTLKYVFTTTSANFGNMFSMAAASLFLPFLPLLPKQILLNNFLSDFPAMTIATDNVDPEWVDRPRRWDMRFIRNFMVVFGLVSSVFDFLTFGVLLFVVPRGAGGSSAPAGSSSRC